MTTLTNLHCSWRNTQSSLFCYFSDALMVQERPVTRTASLSERSSEGPVNAVTGSHFMGSDGEREGNQCAPHRRQNLQPQQRRPLDLRISSAYSLQTPPLYQLPSQAFLHGPLVGPMTTYGGGFLGPPPAWYRAQRPTDTATLFWGFQQIRRDFTDARLGYHNPAGQGSHMYRGRRGGGGGGGGFNRM